MNFALASYYYAAIVFPFFLISALKIAEPEPGGNICPMPDFPFLLSPAPYFAASSLATRPKRFILEAAALIGTALAAKKVTHFAGKAGKKMGRAIRKGLHGGRGGPPPRMMKRPGRRRGQMGSPGGGGRMLSLGPMAGGRPMGRMKGRRMGAKGRRRGGKGRRKGKRGRNRQKYDPMGMHPLEPLGPMGMQHKSMAHEPSFEPATETGHAGSKSVENNGQDIEVDDEMIEPYEMGEMEGFEEEGEYPVQGEMNHERMPQRHGKMPQRNRPMPQKHDRMPGHGEMPGHGQMPQMHGKMPGHRPLPQRHGEMRPPMPSVPHQSQQRPMGQMPPSFPGNAPNHRPNPRPHPMMPHGNNIHRPNPSIHPVQHESIERHEIVRQNPPMPPQHHQIRPPMPIGRNSSANHPNSFGRRPRMPNRRETVSTSIRSHLPPNHPLSKNHSQSPYPHPGSQMHSARYNPYAPNRPPHPNGQTMPMHRPPIARQNQMPHNLHNLPQHRQQTHRPNGMNLMGPNRFGHHPPMHENFSRAQTPFEHEVDKENVNNNSREKSDETNEVEEHRRQTTAAKRIGTIAAALPSGEGFGANRMPMGLANRMATMRHGTAMPPLHGSGHESDEGKEREDEEDGEHSGLGAGHHINSRHPTNRHPTNRHPTNRHPTQMPFPQGFPRHQTQMPFPQGFPRHQTQMPGGQFPAHLPNANSHSMEHSKESEERKPTTMGLGTIGAGGKGFGQHGMPRNPTQMHGQHQMPAGQFPAYPNASHAHDDESGEEGEHQHEPPSKGLGTIGSAIGSGGGIGTNPNPNGGGLGTIGGSGFGLGSLPHRSATMPNGHDSSKQSVDSRMAKSLESARSTSVEEGDEESGEEGEHGHHREPTGPPSLGMHQNNGNPQMGLGMHGQHGMHPHLGHHLSQHPNNHGGLGASHSGGLGAHNASSAEPESSETQESKERPENGQHPGLGMNGPAHPQQGLGTIGMGGGNGGFIGGAAPLPSHNSPHPAAQGLGAHLAAAGPESGEEESSEIEEESHQHPNQSHHHPNQNHHHPNHPGENEQPHQGLGTIGGIPSIGGVPFRSATMPNRLDSQKHPMSQRMANSDEIHHHPGFGHHDHSHHGLGVGPMQGGGMQMHPLHQMMANGGNGHGDSSEEQQHPEGIGGGFGAHHLPNVASMPASGIGGLGGGGNPHPMMHSHGLGAGPMQGGGMHPLHQMMANGGNNEGNSSEEHQSGMGGGFGAHDPRAASMPAAGFDGLGGGGNLHSMMPPNRAATALPSMGLGAHNGGPMPSAMPMPTNPNGGQIPGHPGQIANPTNLNGHLPADQMGLGTIKAPMGGFPSQPQQHSPHPFNGLNPPALPPPTQLVRPQIIPNAHQQPMGFGAPNGQSAHSAAAHPAMQPSILGAHHPLATMPPQGHFPVRPSFHHPEPEIEHGLAHIGGQHEGPWKGGKMTGKGSESVEHSGERHDWRQHGRNASMKDPTFVWPRQNVQQPLPAGGGEPAHKLVGKLVNSAQQDLQTAQNKLKTAADLLEPPPHLRPQQPMQQNGLPSMQSGLPNVPNQMPPNLHIPFNQHGNGRHLPVPPNPMAQHSPLNTGPPNPMAQHSPLNSGPPTPMAQHSPLNTGPSIPMAQHSPLNTGPPNPMAQHSPLNTGPPNPMAQHSPLNTGPPNPMAQHSPLNTGPPNPMAQHSPLNTGPPNPMAQHSPLNTGPPNPMAQHSPPLPHTPHSLHQPNHPSKLTGNGNAQQNPSLGNPSSNPLPNQSIPTNNPSNHHHGQINHPQRPLNPPNPPMSPTNSMGFPSNPTSPPAIPSPNLSQPNQHLNQNLHGILKNNQGGHSLNSNHPTSSHSLPPPPMIPPIFHPMMSSPPSNPVQNKMPPNSSASLPVAPPLNSMLSSPLMHHPLSAPSNLPAISHPMMMMPLLNQMKNNAMAPKPSTLANAAIPPLNSTPNQQDRQTPSAMPSSPNPPNPTIMAPKMPSSPSAGTQPPPIPPISSIPPINPIPLMNSNAPPPSIPSSSHQMHHGHHHPIPSPLPSFGPSIPQFSIPPPINPLQKLPFGPNTSLPSTNSSPNSSSLPSALQNGIPPAFPHNSGTPNSVQNLPSNNNTPLNPSPNNTQFPPSSLPAQPVGVQNSAPTNSLQQQNPPSAPFQHPVEMERRQKPRLAATPNKMPNILQQGTKSPFQQQRGAPNPASLPHHLNLLRRPIQQQQFPQRPSMPAPMMMRPQAAKRRRRKRK